jgi:hypothetical protein
MAATALQPVTKGEPYAIVLNARVEGGPYVDFTVTPAYLFFTEMGGSCRNRLKWVPGDLENDGAAESIESISHVAFRFTAEWTRVAENLPAGRTFAVFFHVGPLTGSGVCGKEIGSVTIRNLSDGLPVE